MKTILALLTPLLIAAIAATMYTLAVAGDGGPRAPRCAEDEVAVWAGTDYHGGDPFTECAALDDLR